MDKNRKLNVIELLTSPVLPLINGFAVEEGQGDVQGGIQVRVSICVEISARAIIQAKYRVCWGPLQTRKDTIMRIRPLIYPRNDHVIPAY